jgi:CheY-like chemotaxis protein
MAARILIADDAPLLRTALRELLSRSRNCEVLEATNGLEAIARTEEGQPDLIILDFAMPVMDGLEAAKQIRKLLPNTPVVMHTLHYSHQLAVEAEKAGVRKVIPKSETDVLISTINELLNPPSIRTDGWAGRSAPQGITRRG